jgi:hypothetical protein
LTYFERDTTLRWSCREGDYIIWARFQGLFSTPGKEYKVIDIWELRDGNFVTITNRRVDLPDWFELHPLEVSDSLVWWMKKKLDEGYRPGDPIDGPNLWRVLAGDRIAWVGPKRAGVSSEDGILDIINFGKNALVYGEPFDFSGDFPSFGVLEGRELSPEAALLCQKAWQVILSHGLPREASVGKWTIG